MKMKKILLILISGLVLSCGGWALFHKYEGSAPTVEASLPDLYLKKSHDMILEAQDLGTGLRQVMVSVMQAGKEKVLLDKTYASPSILSLWAQPKTGQDRFTIPMDIQKLGMADGQVLIRIRVSDFSWRSWNRGNVHYTEKKLIVDSKAPRISILSNQHNIARGGSGLVIYRLFEKDLESGVKVGENFFPGHSGLFEDPHIHAALFALDHTQGPGTRIRVEARDPAGNVTRKGFYHYIRDKKFKTDTLNISDRFLGFKMPDFSQEGQNQSDNPMLDKFLAINGKVRKANVDKILAIPTDTVNQMLWKGRFTRLAKAATRAGFADRRIYRYKGREIDRAVHLGVDLASTSQAPVGAANGGRIIFAGDVGIFGNTVIIDHGLGLASLYAHLSHMSVNQGDKVKKGEVIGRTGLTGLAGGDHLHFSMIVHNVFVNPLEWWDSSWISNNISGKLEAIGKPAGQG